MISEKDLARLAEKFERYVSLFDLPESEYQKNIRLKIDHSRRVANEMLSIAESENLPLGKKRLAEAIGLFHDIGRFEQYDKYRTFSDYQSENHGELGAKVIRQQGFFVGLAVQVQELMIQAVRFHNRAKLPQSLRGETLFFAQMIRDADKLDIFRVVIEHYQNPEAGFRRTVRLGLPDSDEISPAIFSDVMAGNVVKMSEMKSLTDFKILQLGWVFDMNFNSAIAQVEKRQYVESIAQSLPKTPQVSAVIEKVKGYLRSKNEN